MYKAMPHMFFIECSQFFDLDAQLTEQQEQVLERKQHFQKMLAYADNHAIPVFSGDDWPMSDTYGMKFVDFPRKIPSYTTEGEKREAAKQYVDTILGDTPELSDRVGSLQPDSIVVVGGAHLNHQPSPSADLGELVFTGCLNRSVALLHYIREFYAPGFSIVIDPRITLPPPWQDNLLHPEKLYAVGSHDDMQKMWYLAPLTSSAAHTR